MQAVWNVEKYVASPGALLTFTLVALLVLVGCGPRTLAAPESFERWNSKDGTFAIDYPSGWTAEGNGSKSTGVAWAEFSNGPITIRIDASFADSVRGDILGNAFSAGADPMSETPDELRPESLLHASWLEYYQEKFPGYIEDEGETIRIPLGHTRKNLFGGKQGFSVVSGIRTTTLSIDRSVTFLAYCPQTQWETFEPVFMRMLESMDRGTEQLKKKY